MLGHALGATRSATQKDQLYKTAKKLADEQGWDTSGATADNHPIFLSPQGVRVTHAGSGSDWRGSRNFVAELVRAGLVWNPDRKAAKAAARRATQATTTSTMPELAPVYADQLIDTTREEDLEQIQREVERIEAEERAAKAAADAEFEREFAELLAQEAAELAARQAQSAAPLPSIFDLIEDAARAAAASGVRPASSKSNRAPKGLTDADYLRAGMGKEPDPIVARKLGVATQAVHYRRKKLGMPAPRLHLWESARSAKATENRHRRAQRRRMTPAQMVADLAAQIRSEMESNPESAQKILSRLKSYKASRGGLKGAPLGILFA